MDVTGVKSCCFCKRCVIATSSVHSTQATYKFNPHALFHFFNLAQQDTANLSRGADMSSATCSKVKVRDIDQPQIAGLLGWKLAQAKLPRLFQRHKANTDRAVLGNHLIRQVLRFLSLPC